MARRADVVAAARAYLGVRWLHQGRSHRGMDCAGLVVAVGRDLGLTDYDTADYQRRTAGAEFLRHFRANMVERPVAEVVPGDVMLFRDHQFPCHATIVGSSVTGGPTIIHAYALRRSVVEEPLDQGDWMSRRVACFSYPGLED